MTTETIEVSPDSEPVIFIGQTLMYGVEIFNCSRADTE
jgi:hypothetical protein